MSLKKAVAKLAEEHPEFRSDLVPLLKPTQIRSVNPGCSLTKRAMRTRWVS